MINGCNLNRARRLFEIVQQIEASALSQVQIELPKRLTAADNQGARGRKVRKRNWVWKVLRKRSSEYLRIQRLYFKINLYSKTVFP